MKKIRLIRCLGEGLSEKGVSGIEIRDLKCFKYNVLSGESSGLCNKGDLTCEVYNISNLIYCEF